MPAKSHLAGPKLTCAALRCLDRACILPPSTPSSCAVLLCGATTLSVCSHPRREPASLSRRVIDFGPATVWGCTAAQESELESPPVPRAADDATIASTSSREMHLSLALQNPQSRV